jgi:predicted O-methyltransferase YrrM
MPIENPERVDEYVRLLFAPEDPALSSVPQRQKAQGLPAINISPDEGKLIQILLRSVGARRVLEIGTLGGYSGVWMARVLGPGGRLVTLEIDPKHAAFARKTFADAGVADRVEVREGSAREILPKLREKFDAVFVDADKESYPFYFKEAMRLLRVGGLLLGDNAFRDGRVADPEDRDPAVEAMRKFNRLAAEDPRLLSSIIPVRDGLLAGVKIAD